MAQLKKYTLRRGPIIQTKTSLVIAGTDCTVGQHL